MSISDLVSLSGLPGLGASAAILISVYNGIEDVKLYKRRCREVSARCVEILVAINDSSTELQNDRVQDVLTELQSLFSKVHRKIKDWASWSHLKTFFQRDEIREGISQLNRDIDMAMIRFNICMNVEFAKGQTELRLMQERDRAEMMELLLRLAGDNQATKELLKRRPSLKPLNTDEIVEELKDEMINSPGFQDERNSASSSSMQITSSGSPDQGGHQIRNSETIVKIVDGVVLYGTVEGLVERLTLINISLETNRNFVDVLLTTSTDFTTTENVLAILSRQFHSPINKSRQELIDSRYRILEVLVYWLSQEHMPIHASLLEQIEAFCHSAGQVLSSERMLGKVQYLSQLVEQRAVRNQGSHSLVQNKIYLQASQIQPDDLAIALTLLEGEKYQALTPLDYLAHICHHPGPNNIQGAYIIHNQITFWVKDSTLHYDEITRRANVIRFYINTAMECQKLRNFSSMAAIVTALHSTLITQLPLTMRELTSRERETMSSLESVLKPESSYRSYQEALRRVDETKEHEQCVPWLAIHVEQLKSILRGYPVTVHVDGRELINFERYRIFMDHVKEVLNFKPPQYDRHKFQGQISYLQEQLQRIQAIKTSEYSLAERSRHLVAIERKIHSSRMSELKDLGFST